MQNAKHGMIVNNAEYEAKCIFRLDNYLALLEVCKK